LSMRRLILRRKTGLGEASRLAGDWDCIGRIIAGANSVWRKRGREETVDRYRR